MAVLPYKKVRFEGRRNDILEDAQPLLKSGEEKQQIYKRYPLSPKTNHHLSFLIGCCDTD